jgi:calcium/calmodulin-dependent protein kinase I
MRGSLGYFSPEQLQKLPYGRPVDMFALGIMTYTLLCGYEPFYPANKAGLLTGDTARDAQILTFDAPYWDAISHEAKDFLKGLLHGNPQRRLTASAALAHEWFQMPIGTPNSAGEDADIQFE